jgi:hypothetical protein
MIIVVVVNRSWEDAVDIFKHHSRSLPEVMVQKKSLFGLITASVAALAAGGFAAAPAFAAGPTAGPNVRVTVDQGSAYVSADQLAGGSYTDGVLARCGIDRRMQNEPTLAIDPRNHSIWAAGSNDYCGVPTAGDAWAGFYRSANGGSTWVDSLLPGYNGDTSAQGTSSPLAAMVAGGASRPVTP